MEKLHPPGLGDSVGVKETDGIVVTTGIGVDPRPTRPPRTPGI